MAWRRPRLPLIIQNVNDCDRLKFLSPFTVISIRNIRFNAMTEEMEFNRISIALWSAIPQYLRFAYFHQYPKRYCVEFEPWLQDQVSLLLNIIIGLAFIKLKYLRGYHLKFCSRWDGLSKKFHITDTLWTMVWRWFNSSFSVHQKPKFLSKHSFFILSLRILENICR